MKTIKINRQGWNFRLRLTSFRSTITILFLLYTISPTLFAQGNLLISPKRLVFDGTKKIQEIYIANTAFDTARYTLVPMHLRLNENGTFDEIFKPDSGYFFADDYIQFTPNNIQLGPGESITIKVQFNPTENITNGEYRTHIFIRPNRKLSFGLSEKSTDVIKGMSEKALASLGYSIPVIIRLGKVSFDIGISDVKFLWKYDTMPCIKYCMNRIGENSTYGDITVIYTGLDGIDRQVGTVKGVSVYTPCLKRNCVLLLRRTTGVNFHIGKLRVEYTQQEEDEYHPIAEASMILR